MEKTPPKIVVVVPTYNERTNLPVLVDLLMDLHVPNLHVLVVDDNSPDGTGRSRTGSQPGHRARSAFCTGARRTGWAARTSPV